MKAEIEYDPHERLQVITLADGKRAFIIDPSRYEATLVNFPNHGTVILTPNN